MQTAHAIADFAYEYPIPFKEWKQNSNSIISLSAKDKVHLIRLYDKLSKLTNVTLFFEPDINDYTSICFYATPEVRKKLSHLPLSLSKKEESYA